MKGAEQSGRLVVGKIQRVRNGKRVVLRGPEAAADPEPEIPRIAYMLAMAHLVQRRLDTGSYRNQTEAAANLGVTRARLTQLLDLTLLAPEIQETVLLENWSARWTERNLRALVLEPEWRGQEAAVQRRRGRHRPLPAGLS